jgi:hypothetical protein
VPFRKNSKNWRQLFGENIYNSSESTTSFLPQIGWKLVMRERGVDFWSNLLFYRLLKNHNIDARIYKWNRHPDIALLSFLDVDEKFW